MKINVIKKLAEEGNLENFQQQVELLENGDPLTIDVEGEDDAEQLTHLLGAIWILEQIQINSTDVRTELRNFSQKVRNSMA